MKRGVSLIEGTQHEDGTRLLAAIDKWKRQAGRYPRFVPIWLPFDRPRQAPRGGGFPDMALMMGLRRRGIEPMIYAHSQSHRRFTDYDYGSYIRGEHNAELDAFAQDAADYGGRLIFRWDQEFSAKWFPWGQRPPRQFKRAWRKVMERMPDNIKPYYCGWGPQANALKEYYPGDEWVDFVGFDQYSVGKNWKPLNEAWRPAKRALRSVTDKPIIVGEFGRNRGAGERGQWIRTLDNVTGVWAALYFDMDLTQYGDRDVSMTRWMRRHYV